MDIERIAKKITAETDVEKAEKVIRGLGKESYSEPDKQFAAVNMLKGLATSKTEISNEFWALLDKKLTEVAEELDLA